MSERLDEARFELRAIIEDQQAETTEQQMQRANPRAWERAGEMIRLIDSGGLVEGYNSAECFDGCGRVIEWKDFDIDGPDPWQPQGFRCDVCDLWCANECGDRGARVCHVCKREARVA